MPLLAAGALLPLAPAIKTYAGLTAFQWMSVGLSALGLGLTAGAGSKESRVTEQERQIRRNHERWNAIRHESARNHERGIGSALVTLLSPDFDDIEDERKKLERGLDIKREGLSQ